MYLYISDTVLGVVDTSVKKTKILALLELSILYRDRKRAGGCRREQTRNNIEHN